MSSLKVAVIGSGAVGSYYGGRLAEAGKDVHFLVRRDYHAVRSSGLTVNSPDGNFVLRQPKIAGDSSEIGPVDWVICALKATSISEAKQLVRPCIGEHTRILVLMNGLGLEDSFAGWFGEQRIFGGLAFTCINRGKPGHIHHLAYGAVNIGHYRDNRDELVKALDLWNGSKVQVFATPSLLLGRWEKLCWNIPFSGLCVAAGGITTDIIMNYEGLREAALTLMKEVIAAGNADLENHAESVRIDAAPMIDRMFRNTATMGAYKPSTMIDFVEGRSMEIDAIFAEPFRRARSLQVTTPHLALLTSVLQTLNRGRK
ncbi:MAG: 2-dehydropantoate 2-reductase [Dehalococcoidia bacterium]|nr:2-dehydropantoate 2-reductase [Dehalococcoidia bacterium]